MCLLAITKYLCTHAYVCVADLLAPGLRANAIQLADNSMCDLNVNGDTTRMINSGAPVNLMPSRLVPERILVPCC